jgi:hypothetical protein
MSEKRYEPNAEEGNYFSKSLARLPQWVRFTVPNENWASWRV